MNDPGVSVRVGALSVSLHVVVAVTEKVVVVMTPLVETDVAVAVAVLLPIAVFVVPEKRVDGLSVPSVVELVVPSPRVPNALFPQQKTSSGLELPTSRTAQTPYTPAKRPVT